MAGRARASARDAPSVPAAGSPSAPEMPSVTVDSRSPSPPTERVLAIVGLLASRPERPITLSEIAAELDLSIATCHAITGVLVAHHYLLRSAADKTFTLGPALLAVGRATELALPAARSARERLADLAGRFDAEAVASTVAQGVITVVEWVPPPTGAASSHLGQRIPLSPPFGAAHMAWSADAVVEPWLELAPPAARTDLLHLLDVIRQRGFDVQRDDASTAAFRDALVGLEHGLLSATGRDALGVLLAELATSAQLPVRFDGRRRYRINTISTTVRRDGVPVLTLSLQFHRELTGSQISAAGTAIVAAAGADGVAYDLPP